ncbi:uncharacterized protein [Halyomorpha halys]|uniref:uncharacterized protein n=1 Tax=Halyomorpha halys TaxID=286706 RepID=UPI0034D1F0F7
MGTWISRYDTPARITTDQGRQFESGIFINLTRLLGIQCNRTTAYHPQSNRCMERWHRTLKASLMYTLNASGWKSTLPTVLLGLRPVEREDVGASAEKMVFGQPLCLSGEFFEASRRQEDSESTLKTLQEAIKNLRPVPYSNSTSKTFVHRDLKDYTLVFLRDDSVRVPLIPPYLGPYRVILRKEKTCKIQLPSGPKTISSGRLKVAHLPGVKTTQVERNADVGEPSPTPAAGSANSSNDLDAQQHQPQPVCHTCSKRAVKPTVRFCANVIGGE